MYNVCLRMINNETEAEDIMQEAFLKAFRKIDTYKGEVSFGAWLKKIVINCSLDFLKKKRIDFEKITESAVILADESNDSDKVDVEKIKKAIRSLPDGYRIILSLYLFEGYDHKEISQILGISNTASRTQYSRAKNKLRKLLKEEKDLLYI